MIKLMAVAVAAFLCVPQEKANDAEVLFKKMEEKLVKAKTIRLKLEGSMEPMKFALKGDLLLGEGNRLRLELEGKSEETTRTATLVCDDKTVKVIGDGGEEKKSFAAPAKFGALVRTCLARAGFLGTIDTTDGETEAATEPGEAFALSSFKMGAKEKVGTREGQAVEFQVTKKDDNDVAEVTLWIDAETHLPLKRRLKLGERTLTEIYSEVKLDEKIDAAKFELPKEAK